MASKLHLFYYVCSTAACLLDTRTVVMSSLRRRLVEGSSTELSRDPSPTDGEPVTLIPTAKLKTLTKKRSRRRNGFIFGLGGLFGILVAAFFANQHDVINFEGLMDLNLDSLVDVIPAGVVKDARDITVCWPQTSMREKC